MREIEFKGQRVDNGKWVHGMPIYGNLDTTFTEMQCYINNRHYIIEIKPESIGQYIGHKDKNNVKIFENDRVLYDGVLGNVFYSDDLSMFMVRFDYTNSIYSFDSLDRDVEVV